MKKYFALASCLSLSLAPACTERTSGDEPDAFVPQMTDDAGSSDGGMDARASDTGRGHDAASTCSTMNLHSDMGPSVATGSTSGGTDRYTPDCGPDGSPDVWYSWTAPAGGGMFVATTVGSDFDTVVDVLTGCAGPSLSCDNDSGADFTGVAVFTAAAGQTVIIIVDGDDEEGDFTLGIEHYTAEVCTDHVDNDSDGEIDCADHDDCDGTPTCIETLCHDGDDNDMDGDTDCEDSDCEDDPTCTETLCDDGVDNDGDGDTDCDDFDCEDDPTCIETLCDDGVDNDGDGDTDCDDFDCYDTPACDESMHCDDGIDNDENGDTDCEDDACYGTPTCDESMHCADGIDNDLDDETDCADDDCAGIGTCPPPESNCTDGIDNDGDGYIDCGDVNCDASCGESGERDCTDGDDNDGDGAVDCADVECSCTTACPPATPPSATCPDADIGMMVGAGVYHGTTTPYACGLRSEYDCSVGLGSEIEVAWTAPTTGTYQFDTIGSNFDAVLVAQDDCSASTQLECDDDTVGSAARFTLDVTAGQHVLLVIDGYGVADGGSAVLNITAM